MLNPIKSGDKVKFRADYLRSTGQLKGSDGRKRWTVLDCSCRGVVAVDEATSFECWTPEEIAAQPCLKWRHVNPANLQRVGQLVADRVPQAGFLKV